jgi:hypothetical protein
MIMTEFKLSDFPKRQYSMLEYRLFDAMPKDGTTFGSADLAAARNEMGKWDINNPLNVVTVTMNRLIKKVQLNREDFRIMKKGRYRGHPESEYWVTPVKRNGK